MKDMKWEEAVVAAAGPRGGAFSGSLDNSLSGWPQATRSRPVDIGLKLGGCFLCAWDESHAHRDNKLSRLPSANILASSLESDLMDRS
jgi:hypothetical protein